MHKILIIYNYSTKNAMHADDVLLVVMLVDRLTIVLCTKTRFECCIIIAEIHKTNTRGKWDNYVIMS